MHPLAVLDLEEILACTRPLWLKARGRRLFISGGTGFLGTWLLESLAYCNRELDLNLSATVLSRNPVAFADRMPHLVKDPCIRLLQGDVRDFTFPEESFDYILHAAASTYAAAAQQPLELRSTILAGTERMLALAESRGARNFLYLSSGAVYGRQPEYLSHIPEDFLASSDCPVPLTAYGEAKRAAEQLCTASARASDTRCTIARGFAFVGPHLPLNQHFAIGNFIADALARRTILIRGDGTPIRSYLYAADAAIWLWTMLLDETQSGPTPRVFNVGSAEAISIRDLAQAVVEELDPSLKIEVALKAAPGEPPERYVPDIGRAASCLGLRPKIGLREAIRRTAAWHLALPS